MSVPPSPPGALPHRPLVGIVACRKHIPPHPFHAVGEKYVSAVLLGAGALPVILPALGHRLGLEEVIERLDGLFLTGSPSNVEPARYDGPVIDRDILHDPHRDATTLPLLLEAVEAGVPLLAVCRGFQELNVAFGGTLHQRLHEQPGRLDHREDPHQPLEVQYGPAHPVRIEPGGVLARLAGGASALEVNSLHGQGIDRLGQGLVVEAIAPDGVIEGVRVAAAPAFAVGVQWHPEWRVLDDPFSRSLFAAFGDACRARAAARGARVEGEPGGESHVG